MTDKILAFSNCGSAEEAHRVARHLVERRAAACVNIIPGVRSVYRWKGVVEEAEEWTLLIKTQANLLGAVRDELRKAHSYEVPELLAVEVAGGLPEYLDWIGAETSPE